MNAISEGKGRELPPNSDGEILRVPTAAAVDLRSEVSEAFAFKQAGQNADMRARSSIESRTDLRIAATNEAMRADPSREPGAKLADQESAKHWADLDASEFGRIRSDSRRESALDAIAGHMVASDEYGEELRKRSPAIADAATTLNADRAREEAERTKQMQVDQRNSELAAAETSRQTLLDAASMAALANLRTKQMTELVDKLASVPDTSTSQLRAAQQTLRAPPLDSRVQVPNDPDLGAQAMRALKRPIADDELSQALRTRFVISHEKRGFLDKGATEFTYRDGQLRGNLAFVDAGKTLNTKLDDQNTVRAMVEVAQAKNWKEVTVSGSDDFKRTAWLEARLNGLEVRGYQPRDSDLKMLEDLQRSSQPTNSLGVLSRKEQSAQPSRAAGTPAPARMHVDGDALTPQEKTVIDNSRAFLNKKEMGSQFTEAALRELESRLRGERVYSGELVEHGRARYQFKPENDQSYYAILRTRSGTEQVVWGKGLEDAMNERTNGEQIVLQNIGRKDVVVQERVRNEAGEVVSRPKEAQFNQWSAEPLSEVISRARGGDPKRESNRQPSLQVYDAKAPRKLQEKQSPTMAQVSQRSPEPNRSRREPRPDIER